MQSAQELPPLPRNTRIFIVATALVQGGLLYLARYAQLQEWWLASLPGWSIFNYTLVLAVPGAMTLSVVQLRDARFWQHAVGLGIVLSGLAAWTTWNVSGTPGLRLSAILTPFSTSIAIGVFVSIAWLQARQHLGSWRAPYPLLFEFAWQNALTLLLAGAFTAIGWGLLILWGGLFEMLNISFFRELFQRSDFAHLATGIMAGLGILIGRTQHRPVQVTRQILLAVFKALLPLLALVALMFLASLPFTGLESLRRTSSAVEALLWLLILLVLFTNAVYQDGERGWPYPYALRRMVEAALLAMPVHAALALYLLWLRIVKDGWTVGGVWAFVLMLVLSGYTLGYAACVLRPRPRWLHPLAGVNKAMSWVVVGVIVLANSPLLDPQRIAVNDQIARLRASLPAKPERNALLDLRFDFGRRGYEALLALRGEPEIIASGTDKVIDEVLGREQRFGAPRIDEHTLISDVATLREQIVLAEGSLALDERWWQQLASGVLRPRECRQRLKECIARRQDLNGNGRQEVLLCEVQGSYRTECWVHAQDDHGVWRNAGTVNFLGHGYRGGTRTLSLRDALVQGKLETHHQRWPDLSLDGGQPSAIDVMPLPPEER